MTQSKPPVDELSETKKALLEKLLREKKAKEAALESQPIARREQPAVPFSLSFVQERIWFVEKLFKDYAVNNMAGLAEIRGPLELQRLIDSFAAVLVRHNALRTRFVEEEGQIVGRLDLEAKLPCEVIDLSSVPAGEQRSSMDEIMRERIAVPFDLTVAPLLRLVFFKISDDTHFCFVVLHHIAADGWSTKLFFNETIEYYVATAAGRKPNLPELPIQYEDYAHWQRSYLRGTPLKSLSEWWKSELDGSETTLKLLNLSPKKGERSWQGKRHSFVVEAQSGRLLQTRAKEMGVTLFSYLLSAFAVLLGRYGEQEDLLVGIPVLGRTRPETMPVIGCFINTVVVRNRINNDLSWKEFVLETHRKSGDAMSHQLMPFEKLVEAFPENRSVDLSPIAQVYFSFEEKPDNRLEVENFSIRFEEYESDVASMELTLEANAADDGSLECWFHYSLDFFSEPLIEDLAGRFRLLLETVSGMDPALPLHTIRLLTEKERANLLEKSLGHPMGLPRTETLHALLSARAAGSPDAIALTYGERNLSYRELEERSNRIARLLESLKVETGSIVGLFMDRSFEMFEAIYGVMKSGAAYMPIDLSYPPERVEHMLRDSDARILLTNLDIDLNMDVEVFDLRKVDRTGLSGEAVPERVTAEDLCYVMYTSGSSGRPKGTLIRHRSVVSRVRDNGFVDFRREDVYLNLSNYAFDGSVLDIFGGLSNGGRVVLVEKDDVLDFEALLNIIEKEKVTVFFATTGLFNQLVDYKPERLKGVRKIMFGGEKASVTHVRRALSHLGTGVLINGYGPTEACVFTACHSIDRVDENASSIPIGKPIAGTTAYILDSRLELVPEGMPGELYIGGEGLSLGYLNRPELTEERFLANPFGGGRLYKSGDIVRRNPAGEIEYISRVDSQVKMRGFRIEPGEIETAICEGAGVTAAFVQAREDQPGMQRLVAYVVCEEKEWDEGAIKKTIATNLPDFMIPGVFIRMDVLPLTSNGKVDARKLPAPRISSGREVIHPRTPEEIRFSEIVRQVLKLDAIALSDHFFEIGGHSLLATTLISHLNEAYEISLPIRVIFERPVFLDLWHEIGRTISGEGVIEHEPIPLAPREDRMPLSSAQERLWFLYQYEDNRSVYNMPSVLKMKGDVDLDALKQALHSVIQRHEILRTTYGEVDGRPYQTIAQNVSLQIPLHDLRDLDEATRLERKEELVRLDAGSPFELKKGPVIRSGVIRWSDDEYYILLNMHHIASDGWSIAILVKELGEFYQAAREERAARPAALPIQYVDFAQWQRETLSGEEISRELAYWTEELSGELPVLEIKGNHARPAMQQYEGKRYPVTLDSELTDSLSALAREHDATLFMAMLAAYSLLLAVYGNQEEVVVGVPQANRTRPELEGLIGFFVNTLPIRVDLSENPNFVTLLARVRAKTLGAYAHQSLPFERLVDELQIPRDTSRSPIFQHLLVLQNVPGGNLELPGVEIEMEDVDSATSKFDLTLTLEEKDGGLSGYIEYCSALYEEEFVEDLFSHFHLLLKHIVASPDSPVFSLETVLPTEQVLLLGEWSGNPAGYPEEATIADLFAEQAKRIPDRIALSFGDASLTYGELDAQADLVAIALNRRGIRAESIVGLFFERSIEMIVALLGVVKSGGAYLPLDADLPEDRLRFMLQDSGSSLVLCSKERLPSVLETDADSLFALLTLEEIFTEGGTPAEQGEHLVRNHSDDLLYVIYTSGTTGNPKGVMITHGNVVRLLKNDRFQFDFDENDVWTLYHSYNFDFSVWEMYGALLYGGRLVIVPRMTARDAGEFRNLLLKERVTILNQTPQAFYQLIEAERSLSNHDLAVRTVIFGGEALSPLKLKPWRDSYPETKLINMYGITETTVHVTYKEIGETEIESNRSNIGTVIPTLSSYVMNRNGRLVPVSVPGELCIGGAGVARGYLHRPELSAEKFVHNHYRPEERLYRSGDLVRILPGGDMEYLGRIDHQVKIRGFRIELDEIQNRLLAVSGIKDALVLDRPGPTGAKVLCAYFTTEGEVDLQTVRESLARWLPDYMVPSYFIPLEQFPLTPNGKVDRRKLPDITAAEMSGGEHVEATEEREAIVVRIWEEILGREAIGITDNFFEIGGDSILAMQVVSRANQEGIYIGVRDIFQYQTIRDIVANASESGAALADQGPVVGLSPLTPIQKRFFETTTAVPGYYNQAFLLEVREGLDFFTLAAAFQAVVDHHDALRSRFIRSETGEVLQEMLPPGAGASFELQDLSPLSPEERLEQTYELGASLQASFDLENGPLLKAVLVMYGDQEFRLLIAAHHLIIDGVSWRLIMQDLGAAYGAMRAGGTPMLPPKTASYRAWAEALRERANRISGEDRSYWQELSGREAKGFPLDLPNGRNTYGSVRKISLQLDRESTEILLSEIPRTQRISLHETLAAVLAFTLARHTGEEAVQLDLEGHGREGEPLGLDVGRTVGWFTSVYPALVRVARDGGWEEILASAKEDLRKAASRGFDYGLLSYLSEDPSIRESLRSVGKSDVLFNYLGQFASSMDALSENMILSEEKIAPTSAPENQRTHMFEVNAIIMRDVLELDIFYSAELHREETVTRWGEEILSSIREVIQFAASSESAKFVPSDFSSAELDAEDLESILKNL